MEKKRRKSGRKGGGTLISSWDRTKKMRVFEPLKNA